MTIMTLPSRTAPSVRCEDWGRDRPVKQVPIAQWTAAELAAIPALEDAMIAHMKPRKRVKLEPDAKPDPRTNADRQAQARAEILSVLDEPKTALDIAVALRKKPSTVSVYLAKMRKAGLVESTPQYRPDGRAARHIWQKAQRPNVKANIAKGENTRKEILALIDRPVLVAELAEATGRDRKHMHQILRGMERAGMIKRAGFGPKPEKGAAPVLWVRV